MAVRVAGRHFSLRNGFDDNSVATMPCPAVSNADTHQSQSSSTFSPEMSEQVRLDPQLLFAPRGVMIIGASRNPRKPGGAIMHNLLATRAEFTIHAINPKPIDVPGAIWAPSIEAVREPCDLAIIAVSAAQVPDTIAQLGTKGVRLAVIVSAGLTRANGLGDRALVAAREAGLRILGPNCIGLLMPHAGLDASFTARLDLDPR